MTGDAASSGDRVMDDGNQVGEKTMTLTASRAAVDLRQARGRSLRRAESQAMLSEYLTSALVTLLVTVDPPGLAPIFLGITPGMSAQARRQVAFRAVVIAACIMAASGFGGAQLLSALGITLPA